MKLPEIAAEVRPELLNLLASNLLDAHGQGSPTGCYTPSSPATNSLPNAEFGAFSCHWQLKLVLGKWKASSSSIHSLGSIAMSKNHCPIARGVSFWPMEPKLDTPSQRYTGLGRTSSLTPDSTAAEHTDMFQDSELGAHYARYGMP